MGLFDLFSKKKKEQERLRLEAEARQRRIEERWKSQANESRKRIEESEKEAEELARLKADNEKALTMAPFSFKSKCHQRYENKVPVKGLQECLRTVSVVKNTNGCSGYKLQPGIGYIVKIYNDDLGKPNMSDKPMKVVRKTNDLVELRGFPIEAQTPFGWQEVDNRDYGLVVHYKNGEVEKCILHMYDRNTYIEYRKGSTASEPAKNVPQNIQNIIDAATNGLAAAQNGNRRMEQENLFNLFNLTQAKSSQLLHIPADKYNYVGSGFFLLLEYRQVKDNEDLSRAIADYAFFCLSKAIEHAPGNKILYLKRLSVVATAREFFFYTVANALDIPDSNPFDIMLSAPLIVRTNEYIYAMGKYDFEHGEKIAFEGPLREFHDLCYGQYIRKTAAEGKEYIDKVNNYIATSISRY